MPSNGIEAFINHLEIRAALTMSERKALLSLPVEIRTYQPGGYVCSEGEPTKHCPILLSGFVYHQKVTQAGGRQIVAMRLPGEAISLRNIWLDVSDGHVRALDKARIALVPRFALATLVNESVGIANAIMILCHVEASILQEWLLNNGRREGRSRLAHLFCELAVRINVPQNNDLNGYRIPLTQEHLGDATGFTAVHIGRLLGSLENDGLIVGSGSEVIFPRWEDLCQVAGFNARYLHRPADTLRAN